MKWELRGVTTQETAMRESVEQIELGKIMELPIKSQWARRSNLSGGGSLRKADG